MTHILVVLLAIMIFAPLALFAKGAEFAEAIGLAAQVSMVIVAIAAVYGVWPKGVWPKQARIRIHAWNNAPDQNDTLNLLVVRIENRSSDSVRINAINVSRFGCFRTWMLFFPILGSFFPKKERDFSPIKAEDWLVDVSPEGFHIYATPIPSSEKIQISYFRESIPKSVIISIAGQDYRYITPVKENP